jgi:hypothetical protein
MRNLKPYDGSTTDFFDSVIAGRNKSKKDPHYLTRIAGYRLDVLTAYKEFDVHFTANTLMAAASAGHKSPVKEDLIKLYHYKAKIFQDLKTKLTTDEYKRLINTCQNCTINAVNSFDHLLPKDDFSEFAVNPKNLFPSCTECNGYKSTNYQSGGNALFLNLTLDILPNEQYLFAKAVVSGAEIEVEYELDNPNGIAPGVFGVIASHYGRLHLTKRFNENSGDIITELINSILTYKDELSETKVRETVISKAERDMKKFGKNYWKARAVIALINSHTFYQYALTQE